MDATDGSMGVKLSKDTNYSGVDFRIATTEFITLDEQPLSLKFDYKVLSGDISNIGFIMLPETYEFAANASIVEDGAWHVDNFANMDTSYVGTGWATDYLNIQVFHTSGFASSEVILDNLAFGYVGTLGNESFQNVISQDVVLGLDPTNSSITFFNVDMITNKSVKIYDTTGKTVLETELTGNTLDLSSLQTGVYMLHLGDTVIKKIVKN